MHDTYISPWIRDDAPVWRPMVRREFLITCERGDTLFGQGEVPSCVFFLETGRVQLSIVSAGGDEKIVMFAGDGALFGEQVDDDASPMYYSARALTSCRVYRMPRELFMKHLAESQPFALWTMRMLLRKERALTAQIALLTFSDTLGRIAYELCCSAEVYGVICAEGVRIDLPITHQDLGDKVGATRSTVSVAIKQLAEQGVIAIKKRRFIIKNLDALRAVSSQNSCIEYPVSL